MFEFTQSILQSIYNFLKPHNNFEVVFILIFLIIMIVMVIKLFIDVVNTRR